MCRVIEMDTCLRCALLIGFIAPVACGDGAPRLSGDVVDAGNDVDVGDRGDLR